MFRIRFRNSKAAFTPFEKKEKKSLTGFTVIELVMVIVVLGICLAPFGILFHQVMARYAAPEAIQIATALAEGEMERVTALRYGNVVNEGPAAFVNFPNYSHQVIVGTIAGELTTNEYKQVEVRVTNSALGVAVNLITIVTLKQNVA